MAPRRRDFGDLSPRLLELAAETNTPEPYSVTSKIVVQPPTKSRMQTMHEAHLEIVLYQGLAAAAMNRAQQPPPEPPADEPAPAEPAADATDERRAEYETAYAAWESARAKSAAEYEQARAEWEQSAEQLESQANEIKAKHQDAIDRYNLAFFGDAHDDVMEFFEDKPALWEAFVDDIKAEFLGAVNAPPDGTCGTCGQVIDPEQAGKASPSSTSSSTTSTPSTEISPSTVEELTLETGSEDDDPGHNS